LTDTGANSVPLNAYSQRRAVADYARFTYTLFLYESLRISQIRKKNTDFTIWSLFTSDLRVATCYLRFITSYYDVLTVILNGLLRVVTDNYESREERRERRYNQSFFDVFT